MSSGLDLFQAYNTDDEEENQQNDQTQNEIVVKDNQTQINKSNLNSQQLIKSLRQQQKRKIIEIQTIAERTDLITAEEAQKESQLQQVQVENEREDEIIQCISAYLPAPVHTQVDERAAKAMKQMGQVKDQDIIQGDKEDQSEWKRTTSYLANFKAGDAIDDPQPQQRGAAESEIDQFIQENSLSVKEVQADDLRVLSATEKIQQQESQTKERRAMEAQIRSAQGQDGNKMGKRKHQIGSLYQQAKQRELEELEGLEKSAAAKAHSKTKYGW